MIGAAFNKARPSVVLPDPDSPTRSKNEPFSIWIDTLSTAFYHVLLIIRQLGNESQAGSVVTHPTDSIDITPTILDWVGQETPNSMDGGSLQTLLRGEVPDDWRTYSFSELDFAESEAPTIWEETLGTGPSDSSLMILREARFTLVEFAADLPPILFDHGKSGEQEKVADRPEYRDVLSRLTFNAAAPHEEHGAHTNTGHDHKRRPAPKREPPYDLPSHSVQWKSRTWHVFIIQRRVIQRTQSAAVANDNAASDWCERRPKMLHRL